MTSDVPRETFARQVEAVREASNKPKILWHSAAPWAPTAYGQQSAYAVSLMRDQVEVAFSAYFGSHTFLGPQFGQHLVFGNPWAITDPYGFRSLGIASAEWNPDAIVMFGDAHTLPINTIAVLNRPGVIWTPIDHDPVPPLTVELLSDYVRQRKSHIVATPSLRGQQMLKNEGIEAVHLPHVVPDDFFSPPARDVARAEWGIDPDHFLFLMVGANDGTPPRKGYVEVIDAFADVVRLNPHARLMIIGDMAPLGGVNLTNHAHERGVADELLYVDTASRLVKLHDHRKLVSFYAAADAFVSASYGEGFCIPVAEAMATSTPVIAPKHTGYLRWEGGIELRKFTPHYTGRDSYFFKPNVNELRDAMCEMIATSPAARSAMGERGHHRAIEDFAAPIVSMHWQRVLNLLEEGRTNGG